MRAIAKRTLRDFWEEHPEAEQPLKAWLQEARQGDWRSPHDVAASYRTASIVGRDRIIFRVAGNRYRLVVRCAWSYGIVYIRFVGTHADYDRIDVETV